MRLSLALVLLLGCGDIAKAPEITNNPNPAPIEEPAKEVSKPIRYNHVIFTAACDPFAALPREEKVLRVVEINYPRGPDRLITPTSFDSIVNREVAERTMAVYACTGHMHDQRDMLASVMGVGLGHDLSIEGLSYFARTMAYVNLGLDSLATAETSEQYWVKTGEAKEVVRRHLKDPKNLKRAYRAHKPVLVEGISKSRAPEVIRYYLDHSVVPYFTEPIPENVLEAERALLAAEAKCEDLPEYTEARVTLACYEQVTLARSALIALTPDYRVLQFMHRRHAEGGDELVKAWGEILVDFSASLK